MKLPPYLRRQSSDPAWFWAEEWQAGEREADRELAEGGRVRIFTEDEFLKALRQGVNNPEAQQ